MWIALFSQTGTEVAEISKKINRPPYLTLTNNKGEVVPMNIVRQTPSEIIDTLKTFRSYNPVVTLHGYLRIIPDVGIEEIYNGHPGDIVKYPELVGKDPQKKALELKLPSTGCIIHKVTDVLDSGPIVMRSEYQMQGDEDELILIKRLRNISIDMWCKLLKEKLDGR